MAIFVNKKKREREEMIRSEQKHYEYCRISKHMYIPRHSVDHKGRSVK